MNNNLSYEYLCSLGNLILAWRNARKGKTHREDVVGFEENIEKNLVELHKELINLTYKPEPLTTFVLCDPKTRVISKSDFRDRVVHHALILVIGRIFEKTFIYDSCANQRYKGTLFAIKRFDLFIKKVTQNNSRHVFCLKADIKHYFQEVDHEILISVIRRKIDNEKIVWLIQQILANTVQMGGGGQTTSRDASWQLDLAILR